MTDPACLIVPVNLSALFVNDRVRSEDEFFRWELRFEKRKPRQDPELSPEQTVNVKQDTTFNGVHLHWEVPAALARGRVDLTTPVGGQPGFGSVTFPLVPNRWLIIRHHRVRHGELPTAAGWLVHSDFLDQDEGTTPYLHRTSRGQRVTYIGRAVDLNALSWTDPGGEPFLTIAGPGLATFASYQPYNENVFSLHDPLAKIDLTADSWLSYLVAGWHSTPGADPLTDARLTELLRFRGHNNVDTMTETERFTQGLGALGWKSATDTRVALTRRCLYLGTVLDVQQQKAHPESDIPVIVMNKTVDTAAGQSMTDARTALDLSIDPKERLQHEAFEYAVLNQLADGLDGGRDILDAHAHATWFAPSSAGYAWMVVERSDPGVPPPSQRPATMPEGSQPSHEETILAELNTHQHTYDSALRELAIAGERLYALWWLNGLTDPDVPSTFHDTATRELNPETTGALARRVNDLITRCFIRTDPNKKDDGGLRATVPQGDDPQQLQESITAYERKVGLGAHRTLRRVPRPSYQLPTDPVVVLSGKGTQVDLPGGEPLLIRTPNRLIATMTDAHGNPPPTIPGPIHFASVKNGVPWAPLDSVLAEFWVLAEAAGRIRDAKINKGFVDALNDLNLHLKDTTGAPAAPPPFTRIWRQYWAPMYLWWTSQVYPLPYRTGSGATETHWHFDGRSHRWNGTGQGPKGQAGGRILLTALPPFALTGRAEQYINRYGKKLEKKLQERVDASRPQIAQALIGLNAWLATRTQATHFDPPEQAIANILTTRPFVARPSPGRVFDPVRAAQFCFQTLVLVDRFGRGVRLVDNAQQFRPGRAASVLPNVDEHDTPITVEKADRDRFLQLPPRLQQPARTCLELVSITDDDRVLQPGDSPRYSDPANPVCGWLVSDPREHSLRVHAPDGTGIGEVLLTGPPTAQKVAWVPLPGSDILTLADVVSPRFQTQHPHLGPFLGGLLDRTDAAAALSELLTSIDTALSGTVPPPHQFTAYQTLLPGRPLALLRVRVRIELAAPPLYAADWDRILTGADPTDGNPLREIRWPVRLGDPLRRTEGLIGFCRSATPEQGRRTAYEQMYVTHPPDIPQRVYTRLIDNAADPVVTAAEPPQPGAPQPSQPTIAWVTMLVAPWAPVHAYTGILPVASAQLPEPYLTGPLSRMPVSLRTGPLLAGLRVPGPNLPEGVALPVPTVPSGRWAWWERTPPNSSTPWVRYPLAGTGTAVRPPAATPVARTGYLTLTPQEPDHKAQVSEHEDPPTGERP